MKKQPPVTECRRCGACCMKGGPALHDADSPLVDEGVIGLGDLYTLRKGEMARDNVQGGVIRLDSEIVKIKSETASAACMYYDDAHKACRIYAHRPVECRAQKCWDSTQSITVYYHRCLTRSHILQKISWLMDLVNAHEAECAYDEIRRLVDLRASGDSRGAQGLQRMVNHDAHFRELAMKKGNIPESMLDFLFGRPLAKTLNQQFGVKVVKLE